MENIKQNTYDAVKDPVTKLIQAIFAQISYSHDSDLTPSGVLLVQWTLVVHKNTHQRCSTWSNNPKVVKNREKHP